MTHCNLVWLRQCKALDLISFPNLQSSMRIVLDSAMRTISLVAGCGFILYFWSEIVFWSFPRPGDGALAIVGGWLLYSSAALLVLSIAQRLRVTGIWSILLLGAIFGWLVEGVYAMTLFGTGGIPFPLTLSWTGLAWHAPLSMAIGLFWLRYTLQLPRAGPGAALSSCLGLFWGFWAHGWSLETPPLSVQPSVFFAYCALATAVLGAAQLAVNYGTADRFNPTNLTVSAAAAFPTLYFCGVTVPAVAWSPFVIPPLFGLILYAMHRAEPQPSSRTSLQSLAKSVPLRNLARLIPLPAAAALTYAALGLLPQPFPSLQIVAVAAGLGGALAFAVSLWAAMHGARPLHGKLADDR